MTDARTVPALLAEGTALYGERPALVDGDTSFTYAELHAAAQRTARAFVAQGVGPGDRVGLWVPNRHEYVLALLGAQLIGAVVVPLNTRYRGHEAQVVLRRSRAVALVLCDGFLDTDYSRMLAAAGDGEPGLVVPGLPHLRTVVDVAAKGAASTLGWQEFQAQGDRVSADEVDAFVAAVEPGTVCDMLFTSGTTGTPKGVMSTHFQTLEVADVWARGARMTADDRYAIVNPFFHGFGYKAGIVAAMTAGAAVYPVLTFDAVAVMRLVQEQRITVLPGPPTIFTTLIHHPRRPEFDLSSLRFATAGSTSVPETLFQEMLDVLGFDSVAQAYGLTECMVATQSRPGEDPRHIAETTGPVVRGLELRVVDASGQDVPTGADGEVWLRGATVMLGYFEDPEATADAVDADGWLHTGDVGRLDEHGCLKITDRIKDLFIVGGFNVYPAEVENALAAHPQVKECAVIGVPDERLGSVARAYVVPLGGEAPTAEALTSWARERLANFKVPREVVIVDALPRNAAGKVLKTELRGA